MEILGWRRMTSFLSDLNWLPLEKEKWSSTEKQRVISEIESSWIEEGLWFNTNQIAVQVTKIETFKVRKIHYSGVSVDESYITFFSLSLQSLYFLFGVSGLVKAMFGINSVLRCRILHVIMLLCINDNQPE